MFGVVFDVLGSRILWVCMFLEAVGRIGGEVVFKVGKGYFQMKEFKDHPVVFFGKLMV